MAKKLFDFDAEFKLGIDVVDREHVKLVDMLNQVHDLLSEGQRDEARRFFSDTLSSYVQEHFAHEEQFMASIGFPFLEEHRRVHDKFTASFHELKPQIESYDEAAFRRALNDTFTWIITHIGKTDRRYATFYRAQGGG